MDRLWFWLAWRLPRRLAYWCCIRVGTHEPPPLAMSADDVARWEIVPDRRFVDALRLWDRR